MAKRCDVTITPDETRKWIAVTASPSGRYALGRRGDPSHPWRVSMGDLLAKQLTIPAFSMEHVNTYFKDGVLYAAKPSMSIPSIVRATRMPRRPSGGIAALTRVPDATIQSLHQAVRLVNNFAKTYPDDVELGVVEGQLALRLLIEFGKDGR